MDSNRDSNLGRERRSAEGRSGRDGDHLRPLPTPPRPPAPPPLHPFAPDGLPARVAGRVPWRTIARRVFYAHAGVYATIMLLLFLIDLADGGSWWFFYPLFGWGAALVAHAGLTFGLPGSSRNARPSAAPAASTQTAPVPAPNSPTPAQLAEQAEARVAKLWRTARLIPSPAVREQAFRICAAADRIAEAMAQRPPDAQTAGWFLERYLTPTEAVLERYVRLATRNVPAAETTLAKVETQDLPLLETKLEEFYERLHRGDLIDLEVASQMLEFDLSGSPPPRSTGSTP